MSKKVLYIEDEVFLARIVKDTLTLKGYDVLHQKDGGRIIELVNSYKPDICILDVMLPNVDGYTLGSAVRNIYTRLPIIFLTAKSQTDDVIKGFSSGGTDYLKKPFSMEELIVRIENQLKIYDTGNNKVTSGETMMLGNYTFNPARYELKFNDEIIRLSNRESQILSTLCQNANQAVDRRQLLHTVWGDDSFFNSRNLDVYIRKLRDYLSKDSRIEIITLKGKGYHFVVPGPPGLTEGR